MVEKDPSLQIVYRPLDELVEYKGNAKVHTPKQIQEIANSILEFGNCDPIAVWHNELGEPEIVEGHGRLMALRKLGAQEAPTIALDHLTDEQRRAYVHIHNQTTLSSGFDEEALAAEMRALDFEWAKFGFDMPEEPEVVDFEDDDIPEEPEPRCKPGDVWLMGEHRLVCGDSTDPTVWATLIACEQAGRRCRTIELDPHYCDVIIERWENLTGGTACKEG